MLFFRASEPATAQNGAKSNPNALIYALNSSARSPTSHTRVALAVWRRWASLPRPGKPPNLSHPRARLNCDHEHGRGCIVIMAIPASCRIIRHSVALCDTASHPCGTASHREARIVRHALCGTHRACVVRHASCSTHHAARTVRHASCGPDRATRIVFVLCSRLALCSRL